MEKQPAALWRQFAAMFYDSIIVIAMWLLITAIIVPLNHYQAISPHNHYYSTLLFAVWCVFYLLCWSKRGKTIGMSAWKIKLISQDEKPLCMRQMLIRFISALPAGLLAGVGYWWRLVDRKKLTLPDRLSRTLVIQG